MEWWRRLSDNRRLLLILGAAVLFAVLVMAVGYCERRAGIVPEPEPPARAGTLVSPASEERPGIRLTPPPPIRLRLRA